MGRSREERVRQALLRGDIAEARGLVPVVDVFSQRQTLVPVARTESGRSHPDPATRQAADRLLHEHEEAAAAVLERMYSELPPVVRLSMQQRLGPLVRLMVEEAERSYRVSQKVQFPRSVVDEICRFYADRGHFGMTPEKIEGMGLEALRPVLVEYAKYKLSRDAMRNRPDRLVDVARTR